MRKLLFALLLFNTSIYQVYSQSIDLDIKSFYGVWNNEITEYYYGGGGFELLYEHPLKKGAIRGGIEFRTIDWGNQISTNIGYKMTYASRDKWAINGISSVGVGLALFKKTPLFVWSIEYIPVFTWFRKKRIDLNVGLGFRYSNSPAYKNYGKINQLIEFPIKFGFKFYLNRKK